MTAATRQYALSKVAPGDYLLPSNDAQTIWRIARYTEGPSSGLDWPRDREVWGVWRWTGPVTDTTYIDTADWNRWEFTEGLHDTRQAAVDAAVGLP